MPGSWKLEPSPNALLAFSLRHADSKTAGTFQAGDGTDPQQCRTGSVESSRKKSLRKTYEAVTTRSGTHTYKILQVLDDQAVKDLLYSTETCVLHHISI